MTDKDKHKCSGCGCKLRGISLKDWLRLADKSRREVVEDLFCDNRLDKDSFSIEKAIKLIESHYQALSKIKPEDKDKILNTSVLVIFQSILDDNKTGWGIKSIKR